MSRHLFVALTDDDSAFILVPREDRSATYGDWRYDLSDAKDYMYFGEPAITCTANDLNAAVINDEWDDAIKYDNGLTKTVYMRHLVVGVTLNEVARLHADWEVEGKVPDAHVESHPDLPLAPYQRVGVALSRMCPGYGFFLEQGCGKTPMAVSRVCTDAASATDGQVRRVIVVCPKDLRLNWKVEFERFATCKGKVTVLRGGPVKRIRALAEAMTKDDPDEKFTVVIVSYGLLTQAWDNVLKHVPWHLAILDEAHNIKSPSTDRTKTSFDLRDHSMARLELTGTPITNSVMDLYALLEFLEKGMSGFKSLNAYKQKFGVYAKSHDGTRDVLKEIQNKPILKRRLAQVSFIVRKDQVLKDLPEKQYDIIEVEMSKKQSDDYDRLATQLTLEIKSDLENAEDDGKRAMIMNNALVKMMKLAQITSGFLIVGEERDADGTVVFEKETVYYKDNPKLDMLLREIRSLGELDKMIVWSCWKADLAAISARLEKEGVEHVLLHGGIKAEDRDVAVKRYNGDPSCKVIVANPAVGGVGLNLLGYDWWNAEPKLQTNTTRMIHVANSWKPVERWQSDDRSHRRGTRAILRISDLVVPSTIDEDIRTRVVQKRKSALDMQDLKEILHRLAKGRDEDA